MTRRACAAVGAVVVALSIWGSALEAQAPRARQGLLSLEDARIFYEVIGEGEPIVIVHGGPGLDHNYLQPGLDVLAARNTLIYYDQRGVGRSAVELVTDAVNLDTFVEDIEALRQALGYEQISVLTHSFGTLFGLEYARRHPDRLRGLILMNPVEPGTRFQDETQTRQAAARTGEAAAQLEELMGTEAFAAKDPATYSQVFRVVFQGLFRDPARVDELDLELSRTTVENGDAVGRLLGQSLGQVDWWDRLGEITPPTLILPGRHDVPPVAMAHALAAAIPNATVSVLESGHFPYIDDPEGLASAVAGFFAGMGR